MSYIPLNSPENTSGEHKAFFAQINGTFGVVPNMLKAIGNSSLALESMWTSFAALGKGTPGAKLGEQIAALVADINRCEYCLAAHTVPGQKAGVRANELAGAQFGKSAGSKTLAAPGFSSQLILRPAI